jgi:Tfp pilus assembly protein PilF
MTRRPALLVVCFLAFAVAASAYTRDTYGNGENEKIPDKARKELDAGMRALEANSLPEAQAHLEKAISDYPQYARAYNALGVVYMRTNQPDKGRAAFEKAVAIDNNFVEALNNLAKVRIKEKNFTDAEDLSRRATLAAPQNAEAFTLLATVLFDEEHYEEAASTAEKVHGFGDHERQFAVSHLIAAQSYERLQKDAEAIAEYTIFLKEAPDSPQAPAARAALKKLHDANYPQN